MCEAFSAQFNTFYNIFKFILDVPIQSLQKMWFKIPQIPCGSSHHVAFVNTKQSFSFCRVWFLDFDRSNKMTPNGYLIFEDESFLDSTVAKMNALRKSGQFCDVRLQVRHPHLCFRKNKHGHIFTLSITFFYYLLCSLCLHLFDQKYCKNINI